MVATEDGSGASLVGQTLCGRWRVVQRLGRGGSSTVYEGQEPDHHPVAIKVLDAALANNPRARRRFLREAGLTEIVGHPGAVRVFEHCVTPEGLPLLVMERLEGETLRERCERGPMEVAEVVDVSCRVLEVLASAHDVSDGGLAVALAECCTTSPTGTLVGAHLAAPDAHPLPLPLTRIEPIPLHSLHRIYATAILQMYRLSDYIAVR